MAVLLLAEHDGKTLAAATARAAAGAAQAGETTLLVAGKGVDGVAQQATKLSGISKVLVAEHEALEHQQAEAIGALLQQLAGDYSHICAPDTGNGKNIMPRLAGLLEMPMLSDVIALEEGDLFEHPVYAGNAIEKVRNKAEKKIFTLRTTAFSDAGEGDAAAPIEAVDFAPDGAALSSFEGAELTQSERPELTSARVVISGGRGMQSGENFKLIEAVADKLGAAIGASRAAVDAGYVSNDFQVGQTGKTVAPELYIAVGISGAIQHLAGMKDSKVIVAINKDEEAPIFQIADYGLVADLFQALPELADKLD